MGAISSVQYDEIMRQYEKRQDENRHRLEERLDYIYKNIKGYQELDQQIASLSVAQTRKYLDGDENAITESKKLISNLSKAKEDLLLAANLNPEYLNPEYQCPDCKDTGYLEHQKCHCLKKIISNLLYDQSGIREMIEKENFNHLDDSFYQGKDLVNFHETVAKCRDFCENFAYQNLCFYGTVGTGKSFLSGCIAKRIMDQGFSVIYYSAAEFFKALSRQMFDRSYKDDGILTCDLLIIDDLGTETNSEFLNSQLFSCLNTRHLNQKSTIISTNLLSKDLNERYADRVLSRIFSNYEHLLLPGIDIRMLKKKQKKTT